MIIMTNKVKVRIINLFFRLKILKYVRNRDLFFEFIVIKASRGKSAKSKMIDKKKKIKDLKYLALENLK